MPNTRVDSFGGHTNQHSILRFRIALKKVFPFCSRPLLGVLNTVLGQESSSNYSLGDIQLHLTITAKRRVAGRRSKKTGVESVRMMVEDDEEMAVTEEKDITTEKEIIAFVMVDDEF